MKRVFNVLTLVWCIVLGSSLANKSYAQQYDQYGSDRDVTYQTFYDELSPYGRWIDYPGQGYVWVPDAGPDFRPYSTNGHWVWTDDYEWMWVSDYDWGWGPFHYGRWDNDPSYGWYWVPGYEWSPAWVAWRDGGDYYGWAPIRPGINININFNIGTYSPPYDFWCFTPRRFITSPRIYDYCMDRRSNRTIINQTIIINNFNYSRNVFRTGPRRVDVEIYTGRINPVRFRASDRPGRSQFRNNEVSIYRPTIRQENNSNYSPRQFDRYDRGQRSVGNGRNGNSRISRSTSPDSRDRFERTQGRSGTDIRTSQGNRNGRVVQPGRMNTDRSIREGQTQNSGTPRVTTPPDRPSRNGNANTPRNNQRIERSGSGSREPQVRNNTPQRQAPHIKQRSSSPAPTRQFERTGTSRQNNRSQGNTDRGNASSRKRF